MNVSIYSENIQSPKNDSMDDNKLRFTESIA